MGGSRSSRFGPLIQSRASASTTTAGFEMIDASRGAGADCSPVRDVCETRLWNAAGRRRSPSDDLSVHDRGANRRGSPSARRRAAAFCARRRRSQSDHGVERDEQAGDETKPMAAEAHGDQDGDSGVEAPWAARLIFNDDKSHDRRLLDGRRLRQPAKPSRSPLLLSGHARGGIRRRVAKGR
jgi:hypothetical protein